VKFRVLGPLEVAGDDQPIRLGGPRQRAVLAALLLRANEIADVRYLVSTAWARPPVAPEANVRTYIARLRRELGPAAGERLATGDGGYRLAVEAGELDLAEFVTAAEESEQAQRRGELATAAEHLGRALRLWRGRLLSGQTLSPVLAAEASRLDDLRLSVAARYARVRVELGEPDAAAGDLRGLLAEHPLREELWAQLIHALHRAGRRAEALDAFTRARAALVEELGVEPGPALQRAQQELLTEPAIVPALDCVASPKQLPRDIAEFTGRHAELRRLRSLADGFITGTAMPVCVIQGMAGVGKTRLAVRAAHELVRSGRFDELQLWADLRGFHRRQPPADPGVVLEQFLRALGIPKALMPSDLEARAALYRDRLAGRRALVVLDNAVAEEQVRPLLPGSPGCCVLITSRRHLSRLDGSDRLPLDLLSQRESTSLLATICDDARVAAEPRAADRLVELCGRLPFAIATVARRLRNHPLWTLGDMVNQLSGARPLLTRLSGGRDDLTGVFEPSYRALSPAQQRVFRLLGLHPGADLTVESAAALSLTRLPEVEAHLEALHDAHLVRQVGGDRYRFHTLVREYARHRAYTDETPESRREALRRALR
jgi:DNA-binding SARP family transcriptional activator